MKFFFLADVLRPFFFGFHCCYCNEPKASMAFSVDDDVMHHMHYSRGKRRTWLDGPAQIRIMVMMMMMGRNKPHDIKSIFSLRGF